MADTHTYKFNVTMTCGGCSGAVNRVLGKLEGRCLSSLLSPLPLFPLKGAATDIPAGVQSYDVSLDTQSATVIADPTLPYETVLRTIKKTGKKVNSGEVDGEAKSIELAD
jgi:copper chaperone